MTGVVQVGPLSLPFELLLVFAAVGLGSFAGNRIARKSGVDADPAFFRVLLTALIAARLAFVIQFHDVYRAAPLGILDIRDGGWHPVAGIAMAWAHALVLAWRRRPLWKSLTGALGVATAVWALGTVTLALWPANTSRLPVIDLATLDGQSVLLSQFKGKPVVMNLWATWCPPCRREMPALEQAQRDHPDMHFLFLNQGESAKQVSSFLATQKLSLRNILLDTSGEAAEQLGHRALPTTLFFDARGDLVDTRVGELSRATLAQRLGVLVSPPPSSQP